MVPFLLYILSPPVLASLIFNSPVVIGYADLRFKFYPFGIIHQLLGMDTTLNGKKPNLEVQQD